MDVPDRRTTVVRRALLAACLVLAIALITLSEVLAPEHVETAADEYRVIAADRGQTMITAALFALGAAFLVPGAIGIAQLVRGRGSGLLTTGAAMVGIGGMAMAMAMWGFYAASFLLTSPPVSPETGVAVFELAFDSWQLGVAWLLGMASLVGFVVVGAGLLRARAIERWKGALLIVAPFVVFFAEVDGVLALLVNLPLLVAVALVADRVRRVEEEPQTAPSVTAPAQREASDSAAVTPTV
jgi:hypothetical protein